jgi:hypothetical protein
MKPILISIVIGVAIVIVATGFLSRDIPVEKIVSDDFEAPVNSIQKNQFDVVTTPTKNACDSSYPDMCIPVYPPDLDCDEIIYSNFTVIGSDPHGFDRDKDGIGCEVGSPQFSNPVVSSPSNPEEFTQSCDESYPDVCITPYPPDLNCGDIGFSNFRVIGNDPHRFDGDKDGIGCES